MATGLQAPQALHLEGALGDSELCLLGGGGGKSIETALGLSPLLGQGLQ